MRRRRSTSTTENKSPLHCSINYRLQTKKNAKKWINKLDKDGEQNEDAENGPIKQLELIPVSYPKMATTVLAPSTNTLFNDYFNGFHSISASSKLSRAIKYGPESWFHNGNLCTSPSIPQSHFSHWDPNAWNSQPPLHILPHDCHAFGSCAHCFENKTMLVTQHNNCHNLKRVQVFGTVRSKNKTVRNPHPPNVFKESLPISNTEALTFKSRNKMALVIEKQSESRSPNVKSYKSKECITSNNPINRRSILECAVNPYELVEESLEVLEPEPQICNLVNDNNIFYGKVPKKQAKNTLTKTIRSKLLNISNQTMGNSVKIKTKIRPVSKSKKIHVTSIPGVNIAGQKIAMSTIPQQPVTVWDEDWISDPTYIDEPETSSSNEDLNEYILPKPLLPRLNLKQLQQSKPSENPVKSENDATSHMKLNGAVKNIVIKPKVKSSKIRDSSSESYSTNNSDIKSILKKNQDHPLLFNKPNQQINLPEKKSLSSPNLITLRCNGSNSPYITSTQKLNNSKPILIDSKKTTRSLSGDLAQQCKKPKKQVQFIEIDEEISYDCQVEHESRTNSLTSLENVDTTNVPAQIYNIPSEICTPLITDIRENDANRAINEAHEHKTITKVNQKPIPHLDRSMSESLYTFKSSATPYEQFKDTMRLRIKLKQSAKARQLFPPENGSIMFKQLQEKLDLDTNNEYNHDQNLAPLIHKDSQKVKDPVTNNFIETGRISPYKYILPDPVINDTIIDPPEDFQTSITTIEVGCETSRSVTEVTKESILVPSANENCTIVTINSISPATSPEEENADITYQSDINNTVTINVGYHKTPLLQNKESYKSSCVLIRSPSFEAIHSSSDSTCKEESSTNKSTSTETLTTLHSRDEIQSTSIHYMSCEINETLTRNDVGLDSLQAEVYDLDEPIYEEIQDTPPPLPLEPPPEKVEDIGIIIPPRSIFEGASKYDILRYLARAKERCQIPEEPNPRFVIEEIGDGDQSDQNSTTEYSSSGSADFNTRLSHLSNVSDSSDELISFLMTTKMTRNGLVEIERNDSGVGSETSNSVRIKWQHLQSEELEDQQLICEDCDALIESSPVADSPTYTPLLCMKCLKKRIERREIISEIVETEEKYGRDLQIILDEFYKPMMVAGLLSSEQLCSIFLNVEELVEHNAILAEKLRDGYDIAIEHGDDDLHTFDVGKIFLEAAPMLHAFEFYCTRQGNAALLLAQLEKEKELLKIFLRVSQMENAVLRRMNLNSFLMVPVQRVTKYPLLLARLYKVTPEHQVLKRERLKEARHCIEVHLEHINSLTKDNGSMKLWRRISMMNNRRASGDADDVTNIKLQKLAVEILEWSHDEVRFAMEGRLLYAQSTDYNWKRAGRTVKLILTNALLVTLGKPTDKYNPDFETRVAFPHKNGIREASLLLIREKAGKYSLVRDPLSLDHCIIYCDNDFQEYFEVQEIPSKDTYIFKAEDEEKTQKWYKQLQYHSRGLGNWRKRRNALANIMINGMQLRS